MVIGIRREDKNRWEGRVPLTPEDIVYLKKNYSLRFVVQPSEIRAFRDDEYREKGVTVDEDLSKCDVILGVKEIPPELLLPDKIYVFFSHTIKGQRYNMPMLRRLMELRDTLIDYERIVDNKGKRLIFFGRFAGIVGMVDSLWLLGKRLAASDILTPFRMIKHTIEYKDLNDIRSHLFEVAGYIRRDGLPDEIVPFVTGFTGYGNVSRGAQEIYDILPVIEIEPEELFKLGKEVRISRNHVYKVVFKEKDMFARKDDNRFSLEEYYNHPERYKSIFEKYLPLLDLLVNCIYWDERYPRIVTKKFLKETFMKSKLFKLQLIGDISCDVNGSIECNVKTTDVGNPAYVYDPLQDTIQDGIEGRGVVVLAVDNLPCELSRESSIFFSSVLKKLLPGLLNVDLNSDFENAGLPEELKKATIVYKGALTPEYEYLKQYI